MQTAGWCLIVGSAIVLASLAKRKPGSPWRGQLLTFAGTIAWGMFIVTDTMQQSPPSDPILQWVVAGVVWTGVVIHFVERRRSRALG